MHSPWGFFFFAVLCHLAGEDLHCPLMPSVIFRSLLYIAAGWSAVGGCGISWSYSLFAGIKQSSETKIHHSIEMTGNPLKYQMDDPIHIALIC